MNLSRLIGALSALLLVLVGLLALSLWSGTAAGARSGTNAPSLTGTAAAAQTPAKAAPTGTASPASTATTAPSATASRTPTAAPTHTAVATSTNTATRTAVLTPAPDRKSLTGMTWVGQTWNNCGPASLSMVLSYYSIRQTQEEIGKVIHPDPAGKHVGPQELADFLATKGLAGKPLVNGSVDVLQRLVANGVPVLVTTWIRAGEDIGHYRLVKGYDRGAGVLIFNDAYWGQDYRLATGAFDALWWPFNRSYMPVYRPDQEQTVRAIVGEDWDKATMLRKAKTIAEQAAQARPTDGYAWFNLGDVNLRMDDVSGAIKAFEKALGLSLPDRMLWYRSEPLAAYNRGGQHQHVLDLSAPALARTNGVAQIYEQRGFAYVGLGKPAEAASEFRLALKYDPALTSSREALAKLGQ